MATLFPQDKFFIWEGLNEDSETKAKKDTVESYMYAKTAHPYFKDAASRWVYDYIDYGNVFAMVEWVDERTTTEDGTKVGFFGPRPVRISPFDIVFDITADSFYRTPKIIRSIVSMGELEKASKADQETYPEEVLSKLRQFRIGLNGISLEELEKGLGLQIDGFGTLREYLDSGYVEILEFYGDIYDVDTATLKENQKIVVADRRYIVSETANPSWMGERNILHVGWRLRPDNLMAQGPLNNLVGLQYRINHLENLKADLFDLYAFPIEVLKGHLLHRVKYGPGARYELDENAELDFVRPDAQALQIDLQIQTLEQSMEEMAGSPREKMGIRSPGEKTQFEVNLLDESASRIFQNKITHFEANLVEPVLQNMLEVSKRSLSTKDVIRTLDSDLGVAIFNTITPEDIQVEGRIRPVGARHFAAEARFMQNMIGFMNSAVGADPTVNVHLSGKALAQLIDRVLKSPIPLYKDNARVFEQMETQTLLQTAAKQMAVSQSTPTSGPPIEQPPA
jgi:hypothetical protein